MSDIPLRPDEWQRSWSNVCAAVMAVELTDTQAVALMRVIASRARIHDDRYSGMVIRMFVAAEARAGDRGLG